jgi:hypothetical protein
MEQVLLPELVTKIAVYLREDGDPTFVALAFTCRAFSLLMVCVTVITSASSPPLLSSP